MTETTASQKLQKGIKAVRRGRLDIALPLLQEVTAVEPQNEMAWLWLAKAAENEPTQREAALRQVVALNPENSWAQGELTAVLTPDAAPAAEPEKPSLPQDQFGDLSLTLIACPHCATPVNLRSEMSKTVVCENCNSIIDISEKAPQLVSQMQHRQRSGQPIKLGDLATLDGEQHQVIGWLRFKGWDDEDSWYWTEWLLASQDGDYSWLSFGNEDGWSYSKPLPITQKFDVRRGFPVDGARVKERGPARIVSLGGELTWKAKVGDQIQYVDAVKGNTLYSLEISADEMELTGGRALSAIEVWTAFDRQDMLKKLKEQAASRSHFMRLLAITVVFLVLGACGLLSSLVMGSSILQDSVTLNSGATIQTVGPFEVDSPGTPHQVDVTLSGLPVNNWAVVDVSVRDEFENQYYLFTEEFWDEDGYDDEGYWRESDYNGSYTFRPEESGQHIVYVELDEATVSSIQVTVEVFEGVWLARYFIIFIILTGIMAFYYFVKAGSIPRY